LSINNAGNLSLTPIEAPNIERKVIPTGVALGLANE
jgi:hypothetical protein